MDQEKLESEARAGQGNPASQLRALPCLPSGEVFLLVSQGLKEAHRLPILPLEAALEAAQTYTDGLGLFQTQPAQELRNSVLGGGDCPSNKVTFDPLLITCPFIGFTL